jgi:hypothetical protein
VTGGSDAGCAIIAEAHGPERLPLPLLRPVDRTSKILWSIAADPKPSDAASVSAAGNSMLSEDLWKHEAPMQRAVSWIGGIFCAIGVALIAASIVMNFFGLEASYNFGDPAKYQLYLVPFWQIGLAAVATGCVFRLSSRSDQTLR